MTTAIKNDRLKQRFQLWDVNGNGVIERSDFEEEAKRIVTAFGESLDSPQGKAVKDAFLAMFEYEAQEAGVGPDGSLTEAQFISVNEKLMFQQGDAGFSRVLKPTIRAIVDLCDTDGDGKVNPAEFVKWLDAIGVSRNEAEAAFSLIDTDNDGYLTVDELIAAVRDFHFGKIDVPLLGGHA